MKIAFITGGLGPGRDGVGDYARRLAAELIRLGHPVAILGLNESKIQKAAAESQEIEGISVPVLRLPNVMSWEECTTMARGWLDEFNPDWVSLQFVPFAFHPKGLPFGLPRHLKAIIGSGRCIGCFMNYGCYGVFQCHSGNDYWAKPKNCAYGGA